MFARKRETAGILEMRKADVVWEKEVREIESVYRMLSERGVGG